MAAAVLGNRNGGVALCFVVSGSCWWLWWQPFGGGVRCKLFGLSFTFKLDWDLKNAFAVGSSPVNLVVEVVGAFSTPCVISKLVRALKTALFGVLSSPYELVVEMSPLLVLLLLASLADVGCCGSHGVAWIRATRFLTKFKSLLSLDCCIFLAGLTTTLQVSFFNDAKSSIKQPPVAGEISLAFHPLVVSCRSKCQSDTDFSNFSAAEMEFFAEDEIIEIVPNMRMEPIHLISGDYGPFRPQIASQVPLWLAVALKKRGKCTIRLPEWMSIDRLTQVLEAERESPKEFQPLPFHYVEISRLLFDHARDDIPDVYMTRSLIEDIRDVRFHKVESGLETISARTHAVKLKNLSAMEVNIVRPFVVRTLQAFYKHDSPEIIQQPVEMPSRRQVTDHGPRRDLRRR